MVFSLVHTFRSLRIYNYRIWAGGALISNVGTWMQRIAQSWLVLTELTHNNASAVGIVMALQFGPTLALLPVTGFVADRFNLRRLLMLTQGVMGLLALLLGLLVVGGAVELWHVNVFALLLGVTSAFDAPARQAFVSELAGEADLSNAVALNSTSFNAARMVGPAVAGVLIASVGTGPVFLLNAVSFAGVFAALNFLRVAELHRRLSRPRGGLAGGFIYVWRHPDLRAIFLMVFLVGTFGLNFPIYISTMSVKTFHAGAGEYGLLTSVMAVGTLIGALLAAGRERPTIRILIVGAALFGVAGILSAMMPGVWLYGAVLMVVGCAVQTFSISANSFVQLATAKGMRGRVMALYLGLAMGGTPLGAPVIGLVTDCCGPRWGMALGTSSGLIAALIGIRYCTRHRKIPTTDN